MKEIDRAIEKAKKNLDFTKRLIMTYETLPNKSEKCLKDMNDEIKHKEFLETTLICLQSELERQENKALEFSELKEMIDKPVWVKSDNKIYDMWDIVRKVEDVWGGTFRVITDDNIHTSEWNSFHKYEPSKVTD